SATVPATQEISVTFSEAMDERTLGAGIQVLRSSAPVPLILGLPPYNPVLQTENPVDLPYTVTAKPLAGSFQASIGSALACPRSRSLVLTDIAGNPIAEEVQIRCGVM